MNFVQLFLFLLFTSFANVNAQAQQAVITPAQLRFIKWQCEAVKIVNDYRNRNGLSKLKISEPLAKAASLHSQDMAKNNNMDHVGSDGSGPAQRAQKQGYKYRRVVENIAAGQRNFNEVLRAWIDSEGHNQNLLDPNLLHAGFGYSENRESSFGKYWTFLGGSTGANEVRDLCSEK